MNNLEKLFKEEKKSVDELKAPDDLEYKLRDALGKTSRRSYKGFQKKVALLVIFILLLGYNIDTLAYYSKKLIGYENIMNGTLKELNELGKGQAINKSHTFSDGVSVTLDGAMLDDNNLIVFCTIEDPGSNVQDIYSRMNIFIKGIAGRVFSSGGTGKTDEEGRYQRWIIRTHEAPKFYENTIKLNINYTLENGNIEQGEVRFKLDRNEAVGKSLRIPINEKISIGGRSIRVKSLTASPTSTVVKGQIQNIIELGLEHIKDQRIFPETIELALSADGKEVYRQGSGMTTNSKGINFEVIFDALPQDTEEIELQLVSFVSSYSVNEEYHLVKDKNDSIEVLDQDIHIENVYEEGDNTYITIKTEETTTLSRVNLYINNEKKELLETIAGDYEKTVVDGNAKIYYTRTLKFPGTGDDNMLHIQRIRFNKSFDEVIFSHSIE